MGLIIAGTAYISREGRGGKDTTGIDHNRLIEPLSRLCGAVHKAGGISCNKCLDLIMESGLGCIFHNRNKQEGMKDFMLLPSTHPY